MKSEERHQLLTNDLSVVTTKTASFFERHLPTAIAVVCVALVVGAIGFWWTTGADTENAAAWKSLDSATNIEELGGVVDKYKGKPPAQWAQLQMSEKTLNEALPLMFTNRELALTDIKTARTGFESLIHEKGVVPVIRERSLWGLAISLEASSDGDTSKAIEAYGNLISEYPQTMFKPVAEERMIALKKKDAGDFYAWFSKENPKPPEARPQDIKVDGIHLPGPDSKKSEEEPAKPAEQPAETKPAEEKAADKPAEEKPAAEKPAAEKPTTEPPAAEKPADPAKPVEGDKPAEKEAPKADEQPKEPK